MQPVRMREVHALLQWGHAEAWKRHTGRRLGHGAMRDDGEQDAAELAELDHDSPAAGARDPYARTRLAFRLAARL